MEFLRVLEHSAAAKHSVVALCPDRCRGRAGVALLRSRTQLRLEEKLRRRCSVSWLLYLEYWYFL
jgi:hypothetical protein